MSTFLKPCWFDLACLVLSVSLWGFFFIVCQKLYFWALFMESYEHYMYMHCECVKVGCFH